MIILLSLLHKSQTVEFISHWGNE